MKERERGRTHKIHELVLAKGTSRDDENAREDDREISCHGCDFARVSTMLLSYFPLFYMYVGFGYI